MLNAKENESKYVPTKKYSTVFENYLTRNLQKLMAMCMYWNKVNDLRLQIKAQRTGSTGFFFSDFMEAK